MKRNSLIWILEDDPESVFVYKEILDLRYHLCFFDTLDALKSALTITEAKRSEKPSLMITDLRLKDGSFLDYIREVGGRDARFELPSLPVPLFVVSSCGDLDVLRSCLTRGAVDYLIKPFQKTELIVKVEQALERNSTHSADLPDASRIVFDPMTLAIRKGSEVLTQFTAREVRIFSLILKSRQKGISRLEIETEVWNRVHVGPKVLDVHISNLRRKMDKLGFEIRHLASDRYLLLGNGMNPQEIDIH